MEIKKLDQILELAPHKLDTIDSPDCFGDYDKESKLCTEYCAIAIKCCVLHAKNPKIDILEKLLIHNHYAPKPH